VFWGDALSFRIDLEFFARLCCHSEVGGGLDLSRDVKAPAEESGRRSAGPLPQLLRAGENSLKASGWVVPDD
jgi:hypothetical protein